MKTSQYLKVGLVATGLLGAGMAFAVPANTDTASYDGSPLESVFQVSATVESVMQMVTPVVAARNVAWALDPVTPQTAEELYEFRDICLYTNRSEGVTLSAVATNALSEEGFLSNPNVTDTLSYYVSLNKGADSIVFSLDGAAPLVFTATNGNSSYLSQSACTDAASSSAGTQLRFELVPPAASLTAGQYTGEVTFTLTAA